MFWCTIFWLYVHVLYDIDILPIFSLKNRRARNLARGPQSSSLQPANSSPQPAARRIARPDCVWFMLYLAA